MRLIDADELKKFAIPCEIQNGSLTELCIPLYQIDYAPTIEPTFGIFKAICCDECSKRPTGNVSYLHEDSITKSDTNT